MGSAAAERVGINGASAATRGGALAGAAILAVGLTELSRLTPSAPPAIHLLTGVSLVAYLQAPRSQWSRIGLILAICGLLCGTAAEPLLSRIVASTGLQAGSMLLALLLIRIESCVGTLSGVRRIPPPVTRAAAAVGVSILLSLPWWRQLLPNLGPSSAVFTATLLAHVLGVLFLAPLAFELRHVNGARQRLSIDRESLIYLGSLILLGSGIGWLASGAIPWVLLPLGIIFSMQGWAALRLPIWVGAIGMLLLTLTLIIPPHLSIGPLVVSRGIPAVWTVELQLFLLSAGLATLLGSICVAGTRAIATREARYRAVVNDQADLIVRWRPDGAILFANSACRNFMAATGAAPEHRTPDRLPFADVEAVLSVVTRLTPEAPVEQSAQYAVLNDNLPVWLEWTNRGFFDGAGRLVEIQSVGRDVSSRKSLEDQVQERLRFDELLARTGRLFLDAERGRYDSALREALTELGNDLGVDRLRLIELVEESGAWRVLSEYWAPGLTQGGDWGRPRSSDLWNSAGWLAEQTVLGSTVVVERLDDLPESAADERRELEQCSVKSLLQVPLRAGGKVLGALYAESLRTEHAWSVGMIDRIRLIGGLFADVLARSRYESSLRFREHFERLIGDASSRFINCDARRIPQEIERLLDRVGTFLQIDRCQCVELSEARDVAERRSEWCAPGIDPLSDEGRRLMERDFLRLAPEITPARIRQVSRVEDLSQDEDSLRSVLLANGVKSIVIIPVSVELETIGMLSLVSLRRVKELPADRLPLMAMLGDLLGHAIQRERSARSLDRQREELALASRLSMMGEMAAGIAHDVKQPLHAIRAFSASIERATRAGIAPDGAPPPADKLAYWAGRISELVDRADAIVCKYRDFCRSSTQERERLPVSLPIRDSLAILQTELHEQGVTIEMSLGDDLPQIVGDRIQLQQVFVNLFKNACDELAEVESDRRRIVVTGRRSDRAGDGGVQISIRDFGRGLGQAAANQLFTLLYTTKPTGTGLGLAICQTIVADHRGHIWYESSDPGVTFHVWLPCAAETSP
ncbi:ATP-binding protein [Planctellipticum variicoloris]|uniref:ATP-binding protein n=1 Tax=Planctellipticum variicoloris TaxID=3064265 RepID=UPI003013A82D|nr:ATP-binding protein [Planctomycetaceae bacterium SH412]